ncbi:MAG: hypothetical protein JW751_22300 [Polyangiaceae bacterium]|nr:hypothetical protein [Polyangiaceae bacterium]
MAEVERGPSRRGLPSLNQARAERRSALRRGVYPLRDQGAPRFWLWTGVILSTFGVGYWKVTQGQLESRKAEVMAKQRAVASVLAPEVVPHMDRIEAWVADLAGPYEGDRMDAGVALEKVQERPGIYLRVHIESAKPEKALRHAASSSLLDGFVACMFVRRREADPRAGPACKALTDCEPGLLCNEYNVCVPPPRPYNLRLAYGALRVLSTDWTDELHEATNELKVRAFERELDHVSRNDVPIAVKMMDGAEVFTAVLDENPKDGLPEKLDGYETVEERVQRVPHMARVGVWELGSGRQLLRVRAPAEGRFIPVGEQRSLHLASGDRTEDQQRSIAAQQRQANSCALATAVKARIAARAAAASSGTTPVPVPAASGSTPSPDPPATVSAAPIPAP